MHLLLIALFLSLCLSPSQAQLRLASFNIRHGSDIAGKVDLELSLKRLRDLNADLVALQEVDQVCQRSGSVDQAARLAKALDMDVRFASFMQHDGGHYGLAALSRYPILESHIHPLPTGAEPRKALELIVSPSPGQRLSFVSIHLDWTSEAIRQKQALALLKALETRQHPVVIAGDFNATPGSPSLEIFTRSANWRLVPKKGQASTWPADRPTQEIDHFLIHGFAKKAPFCRVIDDPRSSDHRPILLELKP